MEVAIGDDVAVIPLRLNDALFSTDFQRYTWREDQVVAHAGLPADAGCYLFGSSPQGIAAVRSCSPDLSDLTGVLFHADGWYDLRYELGEIVAERALGRSGTCGLDQHADLTGPPPELSEADTDHDLRVRRHALEDTRPRLIETIVVQDSAWYAARDSGIAVADPIMTMHATAALYDGQSFDRRVLPILTGVIDTNGTNPWGDPASNGGRVNSDPYLGQFGEWLESNQSMLPRFDQAALMTGYDMGVVIGLATFEGVCDPLYSGVLVYSIGSVAYGAMTMAHEFGHLIGMDHDGISAQCPSDQFIMTSEYGEEGPFPQNFSPCSISDASALLDRALARCINQESIPTFPQPRCGDGKVEGDEQCDCGPDGCDGRDPCCDGNSCTLVTGATCSVFDGCCDATTCAPFAPTAQIECRPIRGECDVAETCSGSASCPADQVVPTGTSCEDANGWSGACYVGECVTRGGACEVLADYYIFDTPPYAPMCAVDVGCGPMECLADGQCVVTSDPPPDGISCGDGQQCLNSRCVPSNSLPGADGCGDPDQDLDGDGTADCYDDCPGDPESTVEPCGVATTDPENNESDGNNNSTGLPMGTGRTDDGNGEDDNVIIIQEPTEQGCSTATARGSIWAVLGLFFGLRRRRD